MKQCAGLVCHVGSVTGRGCGDQCALEALAAQGVIAFPRSINHISIRNDARIYRKLDTSAEDMFRRQNPGQ